MKIWRKIKTIEMQQSRINKEMRETKWIHCHGVKEYYQTESSQSKFKIAIFILCKLKRTNMIGSLVSTEKKYVSFYPCRCILGTLCLEVHTKHAWRPHQTNTRTCNTIHICSKAYSCNTYITWTLYMYNEQREVGIDM